MVIGDYSNSPVCEMSYERMLQLIVKWGEWNRAGRQGGEEVVQFDDKEVRLLPRDCME